MKDYTFNIRIAKEDLDTIRANAQKANMTTTAYLINRALCDNQILVLEDLRPVCYELRKIGVNINQLTMLAHQGRIACVNLTELSEGIAKLWQPLNLLTERTKPMKR